MPTCAQCGTRTRHLTDSVHGPLCAPCGWRQDEADERADTFGGLTASSLGFAYDDE